MEKVLEMFVTHTRLILISLESITSH